MAAIIVYKTLYRNFLCEVSALYRHLCRRIIIDIQIDSFDKGTMTPCGFG
ncbi:MAG: hypothetical protein GZ091_18685 [Paludibacter sp.]|nr:hypothetical protein [Paludibacter sp.]